MNQAPAKNLQEPVINLRLLDYLYHRSRKTIEDLARETGWSTASISRALNGLNSNVFLLSAIANALNSSLKFITDPDIPESEFHRAVVSDGKSGGAVRSRSDLGNSGRSKHR